MAVETDIRPIEDYAVPPLLPTRKHQTRQGFRYYLTLETAFYGLILLLAIFTRFSDLSYRTLHHDEGVHAYYSWLYFSGGGYAQEPWKHGPFMYTIQAAVFWLFSDSDQTARVSTAFFGVLTCFLPLLLRRELGRWGAISATFLLLISPMFLYYSRFLREDIFVAFSTLALFACLVRLVAKPAAGWWYGAMLSLGMLFCTKEVSFFYLVLFGGFLGGWLCWQLAPRLLLILGGYLVGAAVLFFFVAGLYPPPAIPYENIRGEALSRYVGELATHPIFFTTILLAGIGVGVFWFAFSEVARQRLEFLRGLEIADETTRPAEALYLPYEQPGTVAHAVKWLGENKNVLVMGVALAFGFYFVFYTGFFSDIPQGSVGLISGLWYWMAQQGVARGNQPWFYYFFMLALYEPLALLFGTLASGLIIRRLLGYNRRFKSSAGSNQAGNAFYPGWRRREAHHYFVPLFLVAWAWGGLAVYTWASEKMPWLTVQVVLPFILLSAWLLNRVWSGLEAYFRYGEHRQLIIGDIKSGAFFWGYLGLVIVCGFFAYMVMLNLVAAELRITLGLNKSYDWLLVGVPPALLILGLSAVYTLLGGRNTLKLTLAGVFCLMVIYTLHTATTYAYDHGDVALEMGIYTQTTPDTYRVVKELNNVTMVLPDQKHTKILFDDELRTPLDFYLRDYTAKERVKDFASFSYANGNPINIGEFSVLMIGDTQLPALSEGRRTYLKDNYVARHYTFHYWFEESQYRNFDRSSDLQIEYLTGKIATASLRDATGAIVINKGETLTGERLQQLAVQPGLLDKLYNGNGGNSTLLHLQEAGKSIYRLRNAGDFSNLWRYLMFRDQIQPLGRREFTVYIKKDIAGLWRQYGDLVDFPISRPQ